MYVFYILFNLTHEEKAECKQTLFRFGSRGVLTGGKYSGTAIEEKIFVSSHEIGISRRAKRDW